MPLKQSFERSEEASHVESGGGWGEVFQAEKAANVKGSCTMLVWYRKTHSIESNSMMQ